MSDGDMSKSSGGFGIESLQFLWTDGNEMIRSMGDGLK